MPSGSPPTPLSSHSGINPSARATEEEGRGARTPVSTGEAPIHGSTKPGRTLGLNQPRSAPALQTINIKAGQEGEEMGQRGKPANPCVNPL